MRNTAFVAVLFLVVSIPALAQEPAPARQYELLYRLAQDCGSCHGLTLKGGLGPALLPAAIAGKPDEALIDAILMGRPGTPMPPWAFEISEAEATWLVRRMKSGDVAYEH